MQSDVRHRCIIYDQNPAAHLQDLALLFSAKLADNFRCLYLHSPQMVEAMRANLSTVGVEVDRLMNRGALILTSDQSHLVNNRFEAAPMLRMLEQELADAKAAGFVGLFASGDMTWEFGSEKNFGKLLDYECALEDLFQRSSGLEGVCQYHSETLPSEALRVALRVHKTVYLNETLSKVNPFYSSTPSLNARGVVHEMPVAEDRASDLVAALPRSA